MLWRIACVLSLLVVLDASARGEDDLLIGAADPTIAVLPGANPMHYVFATGRGVPIFRSPDLVTWEKAGRVFDTSVPAWASAVVTGASGIWAPDISWRNGQWRLYYSVSTFGSQRSVIGLATNKTLDPGDPNYRWEDRGLVLESQPGANDFNAIDAACFVDQEGRHFLFWGSFWSGIKVIRLDAETGKPAQDAIPQAVAARAPGTNPPAIEGAFVIWRNGFYYLFVSYDLCCDGAKSTYKVMVGRSKEVTGPYVDHAERRMVDGGATLVLASYDRWRGPGHNSVLQTPARDWLVHHTYDAQNIRAGRVLQVRPIYWDESGWPVVGEPFRGIPDGQVAPVAGEGLAGSGPAGKWRHRVNYGEVVNLEFLADGTIRGGADGGLWQQAGERLVLRWKNEQAPGGFWIDAVVLEADGKSYIGRNQRGAVIQGLRP
ncbi:MAG: arabinan endo-1,5-alpha-L-arabinosidase [Pirellulaceae bacterium]